MGWATFMRFLQTRLVSPTQPLSWLLNKVTNPSDPNLAQVEHRVHVKKFNVLENKQSGFMLKNLIYLKKTSDTRLQEEEYICPQHLSSGFKIMVHPPIAIPDIASLGVALGPGDLKRLFFNGPLGRFFKADWLKVGACRNFCASTTLVLTSVVA
jgi:hypothetical protein